MSDFFTKHDTNKPKPSLIPPSALLEVAKVMTYGASKYEVGNWAREGVSYNRYFDACQRHLLQWQYNIDLDDETNLSHIAHAASNLLFLLALIIENRTEADDRLKPNLNK